MLRAGSTGLKQVSNSTVYSIENENGGDIWEVEVVTRDGTKHEMDVTRDGRQVVQPPCGGTTRSIEIDAASGKVLANKVDS